VRRLSRAASVLFVFGVLVGADLAILGVFGVMSGVCVGRLCGRWSWATLAYLAVSFLGVFGVLGGVGLERLGIFSGVGLGRFWRLERCRSWASWVSSVCRAS
jgi:hypothetical protein